MKSWLKNLHGTLADKNFSFLTPQPLYRNKTIEMKQFTPSSWLLEQMIVRAESKFDSDREQSKLRREKIELGSQKVSNSFDEWLLKAGLTRDVYSNLSVGDRSDIFSDWAAGIDAQWWRDWQISIGCTVLSQKDA